MISITQCTPLNYYDNYESLINIEDKRINKLLEVIDNTTCKLGMKNWTDYYIIHKSTRRKNMIQCSRFDKADIPISDMTRKDYRTILKELNVKNLIVKEII